jgi:hypothetical protein
MNEQNKDSMAIYAEVLNDLNLFLKHAFTFNFFKF